MTASGPGAQGEERTASRLPVRTWVLLGVLVSLTAVLVGLARRDPLVRRALASRAEFAAETAAAQDLARRMEGDPRPGSPAPVPIMATLDGHDVDLADGHARLLVFTGKCTSCAARDVLAWARLGEQDEEHKVVLVAQDTESNTRQFVKVGLITCPVVLDEDSALAKVYNVVFAPRAYGIAPDGTVRWIQRVQREDPASIMAAAGEEDAPSDTARLHAH
jgi:peroxiredoxin